MSVLNTGLAKTSASGYDIPNSLRFNDDSGAYLSKTKANGNRKKWTYSLWIKRGNLGTAVNLLNSSSSNNRGQHFNINSSDKISWLDYNLYLSGRIAARLYLWHRIMGYKIVFNADCTVSDSGSDWQDDSGNIYEIIILERRMKTR